MGTSWLRIIGFVATRALPLCGLVWLVNCGGAPPPLVTAPASSSVQGIRLPWTPESCVRVGPSVPTRAGHGDADADGLADACEFAVAQSFAPLLVMSTEQCGSQAELPGGGYGFVVSPGSARNQVRIGYAAAYVKDCGWSGTKCWLRWRGGCGGHWGDSEFIGLVVEFDSTWRRWATEAVFLSAHCFGSSDGDCRWYQGTDLAQFDWLDTELGAPKVWVAEGKNANYPTRGRCERGHWWFDTCERNTNEVRYPILGPLQNLGQPRAVRAGGQDAECATTLPDLGWTQIPPGASRTATECFGRDEPFRGWVSADVQDSDPVGATAYVRYFELLEAWPAEGDGLETRDDQRPLTDGGRPPDA